MPHREPDTYYLEMFMAAISMSMAVMCMFYASRYATFSFLNQGSIRIPVLVWCLLWIVSAVWTGIGAQARKPGLHRRGSFYTGMLWCAVMYASWSDRLLFPLSSTVSPCFIIFNWMIYMYRVKDERMTRYDRLPAGG